tara:strand:- start:28285 stop:29214 length:930 start_codon:yes stop_codon:yes gene_type:complete
MKKKFFIAGHKGMVGSSLLRKLSNKENIDIITSNKSDLDLTNQNDTMEYIRTHKPDVILLAAAKVGGIKANKNNQSDFLYQNLMIQNNIFNSAILFGTSQILFLGSSCIYPRECKQPIKEEYLLSGPLEPTNEGYALAKIAGLKLSKFFSEKYGIKIICPMPCNLYGTNDCFDLDNSHVLSGLVKRFVDAVDLDSPSVQLWGTGSAKREFLHVDDAADAFLMLLENWDSPDHINVGSGKDILIKELAFKIAKLTEYNGKINWEGSSENDGMPRKLLDINKLSSLGFVPKISLDEGISEMINSYRLFKKK